MPAPSRAREGPFDMRWIAPSTKDAATAALEKRLWEAADTLRANSGLTSAQYSRPVLGLIFLRFADDKFEARRTSGQVRRWARARPHATYGNPPFTRRGWTT